MIELEIVSLLIRKAMLRIALASLVVARIVLRAIRTGIVAMSKNPPKRAAEHDQRHDEMVRALRTFIERTSANPDRQ